MKNVPFAVLAAMTAIAVLCGPVAAETISHTASVPLATTNWTSSASVPKFDPSSGELISVSFSLAGHVDGEAFFESLDAKAATVTMNLAAHIMLNRPDGTFLLAAFPQVSTVESVEAFDGAIDYDGASGRTRSGLQGDNAVGPLVIPPPDSDLALFTGTGSIDLPMRALGMSLGSGAGNLIAGFRTSASAVVTVVYTYTPSDSLSIFKVGGKACGNCRTIGFWKNNIQKNIEGKKGTQVTKADLLTWLRRINTFASPDPFQLGTTDAEILNAAYKVLSYNGSNMASKTKRQLIGAELNFVSGVFSLTNSDALEALCSTTERALNTAGADLAPLHNLLDTVNNMESTSGCSTIAAGDTLIFQIMVSSTLAAPRTVEVRDNLDSSLRVVFADNAGQLVAADNSVRWSLTLPAGQTVTELYLWVKLATTPSGINPQTCTDAIASDCVSIPLQADGIRAAVVPVGPAITNCACIK